jgi:hypothetical protein
MSACKKELTAVSRCKSESRLPELQAKLDVCLAGRIPACATVVLQYTRCFKSFQGTGIYQGKKTDCTDPFLLAVRKCLREHGDRDSMGIGNRE